jgi:hypothetical protein
MQQSEAQIHWSRNNIFLVCSSILLLAFSQFDQLELRILVSALGIVLNFAWLLIQYRSSKYILHWKNESRRLRAQANDIPDVFPKNLKGIEMRKVVFILPVAFMIIWALILFYTLTKYDSSKTSLLDCGCHKNSNTTILKKH